MSWDIIAVDNNGEEIEIDYHYYIGGTYQIGGTSRPWLNITYNYAKHYDKYWDNGIRSLDGKKIIDTIYDLCKVILVLGNDETDDYWEPTEGNARKALMDLVEIAFMVMRKDIEGKWSVY